MSNAIEQAYELGWRRSAEWSKRDDLLSDIGSPAYKRDRAEDLAHLSAQAKVRVTQVEVDRAWDIYTGVAGVFCSRDGMRNVLEDFAARLSQGAQTNLRECTQWSHGAQGEAEQVPCDGRGWGWVCHLGKGHEGPCTTIPVTHSAERAAVPDGLDSLTDEQLMEFVAIGLRHAEVKNFQIGDLRPAFKRLKAMLAAAPQPPEGAWMVDAISEPPLAGEWRFNNGYLCCGTFRVMVQDWEAGVCAAGDMRNQVGKWIAETLNRNGRGMDASAVADKVRHALDKQSCPDHWMRVAFEATVSSIQSVTAPTLAGKDVSHG